MASTSKFVTGLFTVRTLIVVESIRVRYVPQREEPRDGSHPFGRNYCPALSILDVTYDRRGVPLNDDASRNVVGDDRTGPETASSPTVTPG